MLATVMLLLAEFGYACVRLATYWWKCTTLATSWALLEGCYGRTLIRIGLETQNCRIP